MIFTDWYLPGFEAGGPIVSVANLVKALRCTHRIAIVCRDRDYLAAAPYPDIEADTWLEQDGVWLHYLSPGCMKYGHVADLLREAEPRTVYVNGMFSRVFSIYPLLSTRRFATRIVVSPRGMLAPGAMGLKWAKKKSFIALAKALGLYQKVVFHATHAHEAGHVARTIGNKVTTVVLPNLPSIPEKAQSGHLSEKEKGTNAVEILTVARVAPEKNLHFAMECLAAIHAGTAVHWRHIGPVYDEAYRDQCKAIALPPHVKVSWMGALPPAEIAVWYERSHLFFLPTLGENYGHAIAEALLHGVPVLVSDQTPWRNLADDGLGADLPLGDCGPFLTYICQIAAMDKPAYHRATRHIEEDTLRRIDVRKTVAGYKQLFG